MQTILGWLNGRKVIITALVWAIVATLQANGVVLPAWVATVLNVLVAAGVIGAQVTATRAGRLACAGTAVSASREVPWVAKLRRAFLPAVLIGLVLSAAGCQSPGIQPVTAVAKVESVGSVADRPRTFKWTECAVCSVLTGRCYISPAAMRAAETDWKRSHQ